MSEAKRRHGREVLWIAFALMATSAGAHGEAGTQAGRTKAGRPPCFLMNAEWLAQAKSSLACEDASLQPALQRLLKEAEEAVAQGPFSVVDKTLTPPSGDKHDYMSIGPYWWPDPNQADGLPYIRRDGEVNPAYRSEDTDAVRMRAMTRTVDTLGLAYYFTGNERWAERAALLLRTWFASPATRMNPHLEYGQGIPGRVHGRCYGIIETPSLTSVVDSVALLAASPAWTDQDDAAIKQWFRSYLDWLRTSKLGRQECQTRNNHGTWYDVQVAHFALFVGERDLAREVLESAKSARLKAQVEPDGRQPQELKRTRSFSYSTMNLSGMFALARLGEHVGVDLWHFPAPAESRIRAALDYLAGYADPARSWPHPEIGGVKRIRLLPLLLQAAIVYDGPRYRALISQLPPDNLQRDRSRLLYPLSVQRRPNRRHERQPALPATPLPG